MKYSKLAIISYLQEHLDLCYQNSVVFFVLPFRNTVLQQESNLYKAGTGWGWKRIIVLYNYQHSVL